MKLKILITSIAVAVCAFAMSSAHAQTTTNIVAFSATSIGQGTNGPSHGTNTFFAPGKTSKATTTLLLEEIGRVIHAESNVTLTVNAKLVLLAGHGGAFAVIDGANFYPIDNIMGVTKPSVNDTNYLGVKVKSGIQNGTTGLAFPSMKETQLLEVLYNDTSVITDGTGLVFTLQGVASSSTVDSVPTAGGVYTETFSAKISNMTGDGMNGTNQFVVTSATLSATGKSTLGL